MDKKQNYIEVLERINSGSMVSTDPFKHHVHTPHVLCKEITNHIDVVDKNVLVLFNIEFLQELDIERCKSVKYITGCNIKEGIASKLIGAENVIKIKSIEDLVDMKKFDVVIGNPPYQKGNITLWKKFSFKALELADIVAFVTPCGVVNGGKHDSKNLFKKVKANLIHLDYSADSHFKVGKKICYWIYDKNHTSNCKVVFDDKDSIKLDLTNFKYLSQRLGNKKDFEIFKKIYSTPSTHFWEGAVKKDTVTGPLIVLPVSKNLSTKQIKVTNDIETDCNIIADEIYYIKLDKSQIQNAEQFIKTKMSIYMFDIFVNLNSGNGTFLGKLSIPSLDKNWSDTELYKHFNLTSEEIDYIESVIK